MLCFSLGKKWYPGHYFLRFPTKYYMSKVIRHWKFYAAGKVLIFGSIFKSVQPSLLAKKMIKSSQVLVWFFRLLDNRRTVDQQFKHFSIYFFWNFGQIFWLNTSKNGTLFLRDKKRVIFDSFPCQFKFVFFISENDEENYMRKSG